MMLVVGVVRADDRPFKVQLVNDLDKPVYSLSGYVEFDSWKKFRKATADGVDGWLILDSGGGSTYDAMMIGSLARARKMKTIVPAGSQCLSACAIIWAGGVERWQDRGAVIAFHRPWHLKSGTDADQTAIRAYYRRLGYTPEAIEKFMAPASSFFYLDAKKAWKLKIEAHFKE